jgi:hypothetical protein
VARVQLYLRPTKGATVFRFLRPGGVRDTIPVLWLYAFVQLQRYVQPGPNAPAAAYPECVVDTGAHLTTIPERIWGQFKPGAVTMLPFDPAVPQSQRVVAFGGGRWPYDLAELTIRILDKDRRSLDATAVAQLTRDGGALTVPMVLGLRGGAIDTRILRAEPDSSAPFGQRWVLEDP